MLKNKLSITSTDNLEIYEALSGFAHDAVMSVPPIIRHKQNEFFLAIPIFIQEAIIKQMMNYASFSQRTAAGIVGNEMRRFMDFEVVPGYEMGIVFFHKTHSHVHPELIHRVMLEDKNFKITRNET